MVKKWFTLVHHELHDPS